MSTLRTDRSMRARFLGSLVGGSCAALSVGEVYRPQNDQGRRARAAAPTREPIGHPIDLSLQRSTAQLGLFTAEGLIRAAVRGHQRGIVNVESVVHHAYMRWLRLQGLSPQMQIPAGDGWLFQHLKGRGVECEGDDQYVEPLAAAGRLGDQSVRSQHAGARIAFIAPVGLFAWRDPDYAFDLGVRVAKLIHAHPAAYLSAGVLACVIAQLVSGKNVVESLQAARLRLASHDYHSDVARALDAAVAAPRAIVASNGKEKVAPSLPEYALAEALRLAATASDISEATDALVSQGTTTAETKSILGFLLGARADADATSAAFVRTCEMRSIAEKLAVDLFAAVSFPEDIETLSTDYPGH